MIKPHEQQLGAISRGSEKPDSSDLRLELLYPTMQRKKEGRSPLRLMDYTHSSSFGEFIKSASLSISTTHTCGICILWVY
jgi:hypothetical protein